MNKVIKEILIEMRADIAELERKSVFCYYPEHLNTYSYPLTGGGGGSRWDTIPLNEVIQLILDHLDIKLENNVQIQEPSVKLVPNKKDVPEKDEPQKHNETKHYICPTCHRYIDEGLTDSPLGGGCGGDTIHNKSGGYSGKPDAVVYTVRGEGAHPYP